MGSAFDAFNAIGGILKQAKEGILIIDPYMDENILSDFAALATEKVAVCLLTDEARMRPALKPAAEKWVQQYGPDRSIELRSTGPRQLHDRLILLDGSDAHILAQSFKDLAARSPTTIQRVDTELSKMKFDAYGAIWDAAPVVASSLP